MPRGCPPKVVCRTRPRSSREPRPRVGEPPLRGQKMLWRVGEALLRCRPKCADCLCHAPACMLRSERMRLGTTFGLKRPPSLSDHPAGQTCLNLGEFGRSWPEFGQMLPGFGQLFMTSVEIGRNLATWLSPTEFDRISAKVGPDSSHCARDRHACGRGRSKFGRHRQNRGRNQSTSGKVGQAAARLSKFHRNCQSLDDTGQSLPKSGGTQPNSIKARPTLAENWPDLHSKAV